MLPRGSRCPGDIGSEPTGAERRPKTEPSYFEKIKETIDAKYRDRIHLDISGKGDNTVNLFNRAVKDVARSNNVYKHVWLVFDKDDFPAENFDHTVELCEAESTE